MRVELTREAYEIKLRGDDWHAVAELLAAENYASDASERDIRSTLISWASSAADLREPSRITLPRPWARVLACALLSSRGDAHPWELPYNVLGQIKRA
ncbi:hypothetical protein OV450_3408 [Actinobacteria bacterium OV450]|nr:hypothetical protein OV450_3408 [Actinobacteria bacterium OV450]